MFKVNVTNTDIMQFNPMSPTYAFETDNYKKLYDCLSTLFSVDTKLNMRQAPLVINFNGPHGTGKTSFAPYIAAKGIFDRIILYNMVQSNMDFKIMIAKLENILVQQSPKERNISTGPETILLIFDEVDKWFSSYSEKFIDTMRTESRSRKEIKQGGQGSEPVILESFTKLTLDEESDKRKQLQIEFLDKLYNLCEGQTLKNDKKYVIIFNTNDFNSLFEKCGPKYDALKDRFQKYEFKKINKQGIVKYFEGIKQTLMDELLTNDKCIDTIIYYDEQIYDLISDNIEISYRSLSKILIDNCFDIVKTINFLANPNSTVELQTIIEQF
jgi:SpoVK/Ycf46/Vps4 family AAA+-type ATPase